MDHDVWPAALLVIMVGACAPPPIPTVEQKQIRTVYVLPGIEGLGPLNVAIANGLTDGGVDGAVIIHDWTTWGGPFGWFVHLTNYRRNRIEAFRLARRIIRDQKAHPRCPIFVVAHSGGAGIALLAVEALPATMPIEGVILLAGAVSPDHDLTTALARTKRGIWNFYSRRDIVLLTAGTTVFGTMDRTYEPSAGAVGFRVPPNLEQAAADLYDRKLHQVPYDPAMRAWGHRGGHNGWARRAFVAAWIAPIINGQPMPSSAPDAIRRGQDDLRNTAVESRSAAQHADHDAARDRVPLQ